MSSDCEYSSYNQIPLSNEVQNNQSIVQNGKIGSEVIKTLYSKDNSSSNTFNLITKGLHIGYLNIQHLFPKVDEIKFILNEANSLDIFGLAETFLTEKVENINLNIDGFVFERRDRVGKLGGGLLIYIANHIIYKRRNDLEQSDVENIWIEIKFPHNKPLMINFAYRPPNSNQDLIDKYENQLLTAEFNDTNFLLFGDYNINFKLSSTFLFSNTKWAKLIKDFELHQHITVPTRVTRNSSSIIDYVYSICPNFVQEISVPEIGISDHFPVAITYKYSKGNIGNKIQSITYRSFNNLDLDKFLMDLAKTNFDLVETINDPCKALDHFYLMLNNCLSKHIPVKVKRVKKLRQPDWFNEEIKQAIRTRDNFKQGHNFYMYKIWRNKVTAIINKSKMNYFDKAIQSKTDSKNIWKNLQRISSNEKNPCELPDNLIVDDSDEEGTVNVINALNRHFVNISEIVTRAPFNPKNFEDFKIYVDNTIKNNYFDI